MARIDFRQGLAETVQRGLWRGRAHRNLSGLFAICSIDSQPLARSQAPRFLLSGEGIRNIPNLPGSRNQRPILAFKTIGSTRPPEKKETNN
jgi:hypothetical protein